MRHGFILDEFLSCFREVGDLSSGHLKADCRETNFLVLVIGNKKLYYISRQLKSTGTGIENYLTNIHSDMLG